MLYSFVKLDQIPSDCFVIRVKNTGVYIHLSHGALSIKERMAGCFVCCEDTAKDLIFKMKLLEYEHELEIVDFSEAYKTHGLVERQIQYN